MARVTVAGYMIRLPLAGNILAFAQYLRGLELLGHEVHYIEESGWPDSCYDPFANGYTSSPVTGIKAVKQLLSAIDCKCSVAFVDTEQQRVYEADRHDVERRVRSVDLVLNVGGVNWLHEFSDASRIVLVDMDPMFTQIGAFAKEGFDRYDMCFTYGLNVGQPDCMVPAVDVDWVPTSPPVVPELWRGIPAPAAPVFSTIANWSAYGGTEWNGERFGQKDEEFAKLVDLPRQVDAKLRIAASGMPRKVVARFQEHGWDIVEGRQASLSLDDYRSYIANSSGEFSVAKNGYVKAGTGWISDRTVCYLAAGRPVVLQDTGVPSPLRERSGWNTFRTIEEAAEVIARVMNNYDEEQQHALSLATSTFGYEVVLSRLIDRAMEAA